MRLRASLLICLLLLGACQVSDEPQASPEPGRYGDEGLLDSIEDPTPIDPSPFTSPEAGEGSFAIQVSDDAGNTPSQIPIEFAGPVRETILTKGDGIATFVGPPGNYAVRVVEGCTDVMQVLAGGTGTAGVASGQSGRGDLFAQWRTRHMAGGLVISDQAGDWPRGKTVTIKFEVQDRCKGLTKAKGASFARLGYTNLQRLELSGTQSMRSDSAGFGHVKIVCTSAGHPGLVIHDPENPKDFFDLIANDQTTGVDPRCA